MEWRLELRRKVDERPARFVGLSTAIDKESSPAARDTEVDCKGVAEPAIVAAAVVSIVVRERG